MELVEEAKASLQAQYLDGHSAADESRFLSVMDEIVISGVTLAERLLKHWQGDRQRKMEILLKHCGYAIN